MTTSHTPARKTYACHTCIEPPTHPGPWKATHRGAGGWAISNTVWVEYLRSSGLTKADAHLIAKAPIAPKLAEALRAVIGHGYCEQKHPASQDYVSKEAIAFVRAALAEWDAQS